MKARLNDGQVVELVKDCDCLPHIHGGPHWLYTNDLWKQQNQALLHLDGNTRGFVQEDLARVKEKGHMMQRHGIVEIIRED